MFDATWAQKKNVVRAAELMTACTSPTVWKNRLLL